MPLLERMRREWESKGLTILAVTDETPEAVAGFDGGAHGSQPSDPNCVEASVPNA